MRAEQKADRLYDIIKDFDNAMLVTRLGDGRSHARPMAVAEILPLAIRQVRLLERRPLLAEVS